MATSLPELLGENQIRTKRMTPGAVEKVRCPKCEGGRTKEVSLSVKIDADGNGATWLCHRGSCGWTGGGKVHTHEPVRLPPAEPPRPIQKPAPHMPAQRSNRPHWLWEFFDARNIGPKTVEHFGIYAVRRRFPDPVGESEAIVFPFTYRGEVVNRKYRPYPAKNPMMQERDALQTLYNVDALGEEPAEVVFVEGECFPPSTQVLTQRGWVQIMDLAADELVAQWSDGLVEFQRPVAHVRRKHQGDLVRWTMKGFASVTTPNHRIILQRRHGDCFAVEAGSLRPDSRHVIPRAGYCHGPGILLTDDRLRLAIAVSADAAIDTRKNTGNKKGKESRYARFGLKKQRKIDRLRKLLLSCQIEFSESLMADGCNSICFSLPEWVPGRLLPWGWITDASLAQRELILEELVHWDGNSVKNRNQTEFSSRFHELAEWVQALAHTSGFCSTVMQRTNKFGSWFKVSLLHGKQHTGTQYLKRVDQPYIGDVYCLSMPSGALLTRQEGFVSVSGNCDVMGLHEAGFPHAVTLKDGAPASVNSGNEKRFAALATHADMLAKVPKIILAGDMDAPGLALREELAQRLGRHRVWLVDWPEGCKDACDVLARHGVEAVQEAMAKAKPYPISGLRRIEAGSLVALRNTPPTPTMTIGVPCVDEIMKLPTEGRLIVVTGYPASGKTSFVRFLMVRTAHRANRKWLVFSPEMQPWMSFVAECAEVLAGAPFWAEGGRPRMTDDEAERAERWLGERMFMLETDSEDEAPTLDWLIERARYAVLSLGVTDLLIDPWNELDHGRQESQSETDYIGRALQRLKAFAGRHGVNVWIIAHPAKPPALRNGEKLASPGPYQISGSAHWANKTDLGFTLHQPEGVQFASDLHLWKSRFRRWGVKGKLAQMVFDPLCGRYSGASVDDDHGLFE